MTVRLGTNRDKTFSIYAHDKAVGQAVTQYLMQRTIPRLLLMPEIKMDDFQAMIHNPTIVEALGGQAPGEIAVEHWRRLSALEYLRRLTGKMQSLGRGDDADKLRACMSEPLCAISEGRFRTLLNEALDWKAAQLDEAVKEVNSWTDSG